MDEKIRSLVLEYCKNFRNPALEPFQVCDVLPWKGWWRSEQSSKPGCYVIYSDVNEPMYIGKASLKASMGSRLASHERNRNGQWEDAKFIQMILVSKSFEAPSLEEFLLSRLSTTHNKIGRSEPNVTQ